MSLCFFKIAVIRPCNKRARSSFHFAPATHECITKEELTVARQRSQSPRRATRAVASVQDLDAEEAELAAARLLRLPTKSLPDSFWGMPAPQVSFEEAVLAVTSERDEG